MKHTSKNQGLTVTGDAYIRQRRNSLLSVLSSYNGISKGQWLLTTCLRDVQLSDISVVPPLDSQSHHRFTFSSFSPCFLYQTFVSSLQQHISSWVFLCVLERLNLECGVRGGAFVLLTMEVGTFAPAVGKGRGNGTLTKPHLCFKKIACDWAWWKVLQAMVIIQVLMCVPNNLQDFQKVIILDNSIFKAV